MYSFINGLYNLMISPFLQNGLFFQKVLVYKILKLFIKSNLAFQMMKIGKLTKIYGLKIDYDDFLTLN